MCGYNGLVYYQLLGSPLLGHIVKAIYLQKRFSIAFIRGEGFPRDPQSWQPLNLSFYCNTPQKKKRFISTFGEFQNYISFQHKPQQRQQQN